MSLLKFYKHYKTPTHQIKKILKENDLDDNIGFVKF
jgi:hypothetical protein